MKAAIMVPMSPFRTDAWRLILSPPASGAFNMALDEALLESVSSGASPPTLRLYAWEPPCLSLGFAQEIAEIDRSRLQEVGWQIVRRPTGGRAILHVDELTYAVATPIDNPHVKGGVLATYRHLSEGLIAGLTLMDLPIEVQPETKKSDAERRNPICFEVPSSYEITAGGKKLLGSAQVRRVRGILQHGTLPLRGDISRICQVLRFDRPTDRARAVKRLLARATTLSELLGREVTWEEAAERIADGFRQGLQIDLQAGEPTEDELRRARQLESSRYRSDRWTILGKLTPAG